MKMSTAFLFGGLAGEEPAGGGADGVEFEGSGGDDNDDEASFARGRDDEDVAAREEVEEGGDMSRMDGFDDMVFAGDALG